MMLTNIKRLTIRTGFMIVLALSIFYYVGCNTLFEAYFDAILTSARVVRYLLGVLDISLRECIYRWERFWLLDTVGIRTN